MINETQNTEKLEEFKKIHQTYLEEVAKEYDEKNKGNYFHYDWKINEDNSGISWENGGGELVGKGRDLISKSMILFSPEFQNLYDQIDEIWQSNNFIRKPLDDVRSNLSYLTSTLKGIEQGRFSFNESSSFGLYSKMKGFSMYGGVKEIPTEYIWELGEMVFHQTRIEEISHACQGNTHYTCRKLDEILRNMHVEYFREKKPELGEALIKEILTEKNKSNDSARKALEVIPRYKIKNEELINTIEDILILETNRQVETGRIRREESSLEEEYKTKKEKILGKIGLKPAYS